MTLGNTGKDQPTALKLNIKVTTIILILASSILTFSLFIKILITYCILEIGIFFSDFYAVFLFDNLADSIAVGAVAL